MAIAGFHGADISKKSTLRYPKGQNMVAKSAYISREGVYDKSERVMKYPHASKLDMECPSEIFLPPGAPEKYKDPSVLWSEIQAMKYDNLGKLMILSLPAEATEEQRHEMVELFVKRNLTSQYLICQVGYHKEKLVPSGNNPRKKVRNKNFHAHVLSTELQMIDGKWSETKSQKPYVDRNGIPLQKTETPRLKNKRLQYDENGNIVMKIGWQQLQFNDDGTPKLYEDGRPVLKDIRTPETDDKGVQIWKKEKGKLRPQWKRKEIHAATVTKYGWIADFRKSWGECQNEILKKYDIKNEHGELVQVDMRSYKNQDKDFNDGEHQIPQIKVFEPYDEDQENTTRHNIIEENKKRKKHNELIKKIRRARKEKENVDNENAKNKKEEETERQLVEEMDPKSDWTQTWVRHATELQNEVERVYANTSLQLSNKMYAAEQQLKKLPDTSRHNIEYNRITRHYKLMSDLTGQIDPNKVTDSEYIKKIAEQAWEKLTDQQKVSYVRDRFGLEKSKIYARILATENNNINIIDGLEEKAPDYPHDATNKIITDKVAKQICKTDNFKKYETNAFAKWDTATYQAPPQEVINVINTYGTLGNYYERRLSQKPLYLTNITGGINYNPQEIEQIAKQENEELTKIVQAEKAKQEARHQAELKHQAELQRSEELKRQEEARRQTEQKHQAELQRSEELKRQEEARHQTELKHQAELQRQAELKRQKYSINQVKSSWQSLIPQYQVAVTMKDHDTINKMSGLVNEAFTKEQLETMYNNAKHFRNSELETITNKYIDLHSGYGINEEIVKDLERKFYDKRNKPIVRNINNAIAEHNAHIKNDWDAIDTSKYQRYSDEASFLYGMLHPESSIRDNKTKAPETVTVKTEIQIDLPNNRTRTPKGLPYPQKSSGISFEIMPDGSSVPIQIGPNTLKKESDHEKSAMEKAEDELYKEWDPWKNSRR